MKKNILYLTLFIAICIFDGCARIKYLIFDMRPIEMQTPVSIANFIHEKNIDSNNIYLLKEQYLLKSLKESINKAWVFDKNGFNIMYDLNAENKKCLGNIWAFILNYKRGDKTINDSSLTFSTEYLKWLNLSGNNLESFPPLGGDLTIVYYWNTFSGNTNHRNFFKEIKQLIAERPDLEINFYKINQDLREGMDIEKYARELISKDSLMNKSAP